jgi:ADP-ribose pyrophosphatase YjhB (NUDIX family)
MFTSKRFPYIWAVYLFLGKDWKILLSRRLNTWYEDWNYGLPSGHMDGNETPRQAMTRESSEEIWINLNIEDLKMVTMMYRKKYEDERFDFFFVANKRNWEIINNEPNKCDDLNWFDINNLPDNTIPYIKKAINNRKNWILYDEIIL